MSAQATPAFGTTPSVSLRLGAGGDTKMSWAATRVQQKLWIEENETSKAVSARRLAAYVRPSGLIFLVCGAALIALATRLPELLSLADVLVILGQASVSATGVLFLAVGLVRFFSDVVAAGRHTSGDPVGTVKTYFRAVTRGTFDAAYAMLTRTERNNIVRPLPSVPGMSKADPIELTFDSADGFQAYWEHTLHKSRPEGWRDDYSFLSAPLRWVKMDSLRPKRVSKQMMVVRSTMTIYHLPFWTLLSALFGVIPAFFVIPRYMVKIRLGVQKAVLKTPSGWRLMNGELISAEDLAGLKLAAK